MDLEPSESKNIILNWRHRASDLIFGPHQLSDGTLRAICLVSLFLKPKKDHPCLIVVGTYLKIGKLKLVFEMTVMYHWCMVNLTDVQWQRIRHHFPEELRPKSHPGRKPRFARVMFLKPSFGF